MSKLEAQADGIPYRIVRYEKTRGKSVETIYEIPCEQCGRTIESRIYSRGRSFVCQFCKTGIKEFQKEQKQIDIYGHIPTKHEKRFTAACDELRQAVGPKFQKYEKAIRAAKTRSDKYGSIPEVMAAIELLKCGYKIIPQQKIGNRRVDFCIPDQKLIIEIDGEAYHKDRIKQLERDGEIQFTIGLEWKIIHVPAELMRESIWKLSPFIKKAIKI